MYAKACTLPAEIINDSFRRLSGLIQQFEVCWIGDVGRGAGGINAEGAPILSLRPIGGLDQVVKGQLIISVWSLIV